MVLNYSESGNAIELSADGNTIVIGASKQDETASNSGQVRVYVWDEENWTQKGSALYGEDNFDRFGYSVSLNADGNTLAVGAIMNSGGGTDAGHVRVFEWNSSAWEQKGIDINGEAADDNSGSSLSISANGNVLAIGAKGNDATFGFNAVAGQVRVSQWNGSAWTQLGDDIDGLSGSDYFGE